MAPKPPSAKSDYSIRAAIVTPGERILLQLRGAGGHAWRAESHLGLRKVGLTADSASLAACATHSQQGYLLAA